MLVHQKAAEGNVKLTDGLVPHFPVPDDMDDWHWAMSLNQARAVAPGRRVLPVAAARAAPAASCGSSTTAGRSTSWAAIDGDGRRKPLLYALRARPRRPAGHRAAGRTTACGSSLVNDTAERWSGPVRLSARRVRRSRPGLGAGVAHGGGWITVTAPVPSSVAEFGAPEWGAVAFGERGGARAVTPVEPRDSALAAAALTTSVTVLAAGAGAGGGRGLSGSR